MSCLPSVVRTLSGWNWTPSTVEVAVAEGHDYAGSGFPRRHLVGETPCGGHGCIEGVGVLRLRGARFAYPAPLRMTKLGRMRLSGLVALVAGPGADF